MTTISSVLEKFIQSLCLNDFPCGAGDWRTAAHREDPQALLDLITCPRSPWYQQSSWSEEAKLLREAAVLTPESLNKPPYRTAFRTLRVVDRGVCVVDEGLLSFSKLETLVLSANKICTFKRRCLPPSLKVLELHANLLCGLTGLVQQNLPELLHLGVGSNRLGSLDDANHLTGEFWPRLVSLDLSGCDFQDQQVLAQALATLACLRTLSLTANPLTLVPSYPGFMIDSLQQLLHLDGQRVTPDQRRGFKGLSLKARDPGILKHAVATVKIQRAQGVPEPHLGPDPSPTEFSAVEYSYRVAYDFMQPQPSEHLEKSATSDSEVQTSCHDAIPVLTHTTDALAWDKCMDFLHAQTFVVRDLPALKRFLSQGIWLRLEEDKVVSRPACSPDQPNLTPTPKDRKTAQGNEASNKVGSQKKSVGSKDKKKKLPPDLVRDGPITTVLGCVGIPLDSLLKGTSALSIVCNFGLKPTMRPMDKVSWDNRNDERSSKGTGKAWKDSQSEEAAGSQQEPITVEFSINLEKWHSASEANPLQTPGPP